MACKKYLYSSILIISCSCVAQTIDEAKALISKEINEGNFDKAYELIVNGIYSTDPELQHTLALLISNGYGSVSEGERDAVALQWIVKSAKQDYSDSVMWLSDSFRNGWFGLDVDIAAADCWLRNGSNCRVPE